MATMPIKIHMPESAPPWLIGLFAFLPLALLDLPRTFSIHGTLPVFCDQQRPDGVTLTYSRYGVLAFQRAKEAAAFWLDQANPEQAAWAEALLDWLDVDPDTNTAVCMLDCGVNNGHPLIAAYCNSICVLMTCHFYC